MANSFRDTLKEIEKLGSQRPAVYDWLDEEFKKKEAQRALEKEARRKAEEWIRQRPTLQKAVDVVLPGSQFRTPPATFSPAPRTEPVSEEPWSEKIARALIGSKEFREQTFKDLLSFLPLAPAAIPGAGPALAPVVSPAISKAVAPAARAAEKAVTAYRALPKAAQTAAKVAAGIGAAATAEEMTRGAIVPKAKEQTLPAKFGASLRAGFGDLVAATGTVAKMLKQEGLGEKLQRAGEAVTRGFESEPVEFSWKSFFDPDFYAVNAARSLPLTLALIPAMYTGYRLGGAAGTKLGLRPFQRVLLASITGASLSRPLESAFEAADTYEQYLAEHPGDVKGAEKAAQNTFLKNLSLLGIDTAQLMLAFAPPQVKPASYVAKAVEKFGPRAAQIAKVATTLGGEAAMEAVEEGIQDVIQRTSTGQPIRFDSKMQEAMAIGGLFGLGFGGTGEIVDFIRDRTFSKLPSELQSEVVTKAAEKGRTLPRRQAWEQAFDEVMESDPEKGAVIAGAVDEAVAELDGLIEEAGTLYQRPEIEAIARKAVEKTEKAPSVPPTPKKIVTKAIGKPAEEFSPGDIVFDKKGRRWRVVDTSDPSLLEVVNEKGARTKLGRKAVVKAAEESETVISEEKPVGEIEKAPSVPPLSVETYVEGEMAPVPETPILEEIEMAPERAPVVGVPPEATGVEPEEKAETPTPITEARRQKILNTKVNFGKEYGVMTRREFLEARLSEGARVEAVKIKDQSATEKAEKELKELKQRYIPGLSNPNTPTAKRYHELEKKLKEGIYKTEYRLVMPDDTFYDITKTEYDYGKELEREPAPAEEIVPAEEEREEAEAKAPTVELPTEIRPADEMIDTLITTGAAYFEPLTATSVRVYRPSPVTEGEGEFSGIIVKVVAPDQLKFDTPSFVLTADLRSKAEKLKPLSELKEYVKEVSNRMREAAETWDKADKETRIEIARRLGWSKTNSERLAKQKWEELSPASATAIISGYDTVKEIVAAKPAEVPSVPVEGKETGEGVLPGEKEVKPKEAETIVAEKPQRKKVIGNVKVSTVEMKDGSMKAKLEAPYHPALPDKARAIGGKWSSEKKAWYFDERDLEKVKNLAYEIYGTRGEGEEVPVVDVVVNLGELPKKLIAGKDLFLFGRQIASRFSRDSRVKLGEGVVIREGGFSSRGGSARYPELAPEEGTILEIRDVPVVFTEEIDFPIEIISGTIEEERKEGGGGVLPGEERREGTGEPGGAGVEGRGPEVLGEVPPEDVRGAEGETEVRGEPEPGRGERAEGERRAVPETEGAAPREERTGLPEEGGAETDERPHGPGISEEGIHISAAGARSDVDRGRNYVITEEDDIGEGGPVTKARNNIEAVKIVKKLEEEGRVATVEEQKKLVKFSGWGSCWQIFEPWKYNNFRNLYDELRELLTYQEFNAASRSTQNAHYTSPEVIKAMWDALKHFGFDGGRILEPALGVGHFFGYLPVDLAAKSKLVGIELDKMTGKIAEYLYPEANIYIQGFEETALPDNFFDVAISNVPFGDIQIADSSYPRYLTRQIHNYFFVKALDKIRPGGLIMFITSTGTLDARTNRDVRKYLAEKADFIGAVRLPGSTFRGIAQTDVTIDIVILKKKIEGQEPIGETWTESKESGLISKVDGKPLYFNEYFLKHPEMVLGKLAEDKLHTGRIGVEPDGRDIAQALKEAFERLPADIFEKIKPKKQTPKSDKEILEGKPEIAEGTFVIRDDKVYQSVGGNLVRVEKNEEVLKGMIGIRDAALEVLKVQYKGESDEVLKEAQGHLNKLYDEFVREHNSLQQNLDLFKNDPHAYLLESLEEVEIEPKTKEIKKIKKADIFTKRTIRAFQREFQVETPKEALLISLNEEGRINWERMAQLTGKTEKELQEELEGLVFKNPEGDWETAEAYLSGNVRAKLKAAEVAAEIDPEFQKNVEALKKVQPRDLEPHEITAALGAPWIPAEYIEYFVNNHILNSYEAVKVTKIPLINRWKLDVSRQARGLARNTQIWGVPEAPAVTLIELALNKKMPVIYRKVDNVKIVDEQKTQAARQKQQKLQEEFNNWFWSDPERAKEFAPIYNEVYNNLRLTSYDGSHLTFPGMNTKIELHPHQKNAAWRIISSKGNTLLAHSVGKGKTYAMAAAIMELRRLGLAKKPMIVVPNLAIEQWPREFKKLYPGAKILVLSSGNLPGVFADKKEAGESDEAFEKRRDENAQKRKAALMQIVTGDWDAVIIPSHLFTRLPVSPEWERAFIEEQVAELRAIITEMRKASDKASKRTVKQLEKILQNFEARLKLDINEIKRDIVMPFEELGIDYLFVDEAHFFKNLRITTKMSNVSGVPSSEAKRALDMFMKTQWITKLNNGKGIVFATGTPITNTMAEMYNLQRYLAPNTLKALDVAHFDDWATMFGTIKTAWEISADGRTYQQKTSFREFINVSELLKQFRLFADVVLTQEGEPGIPKLKDGKRTIITAEPSPEQDELIQWCVKRLESFKRGGYDPKEDNPLKVCVDGQKIALDPRLIDPKLPENPNSKVNKAVANIFDIWQKTRDKRSTQLVFLDLSVPKSKADFEVEAEEETAKVAEENIIIYREIKKKLISLGVPANEIVFIHEATTPAKKKELSDAMNEGKIRILIGSTGKMGLALNVQRKLYALHHLDCPWRPDELEQREGRILRPGNENEEVEIFVYGTEKSFDTMRWNKVVNKARFIAQALVAGDDIRVMEDIDEVVLSYEEAKAAVSGNPLVEEKLKVDTEVRRLQMLRIQHFESRREMIGKIDTLENTVKYAKRHLEDLKKDLERKKDVSGDKFSIKILGKTYTNRKEANEALKEVLKELPKPTLEYPEIREEVGSFAGFKLFVKRIPGENIWELVGRAKFTNLFSEDSIRSMEIRLDSIKDEIKRTENRLKGAEKEITELKAEIDKPFPEQEKLNELLIRQREINQQLGISDVGEEEIMADTPSEDETYPLPALEELRNKADIALANRVKGVPREKDIYALPLFAPQKTSVKQVARGLRLAAEKGIFKKGMVVADIGGGLYNQGTQYLAEHGITNLVYDPYARPEEHNNSVLQQIKARGGADAVALNNVLNVIPKAAERADVLRFSYGLLKNGGQMVVTVYEGNKSGKGSMKEFKDGTYTWQENRTLDSYEKEIREVLPGANVEKKHGAFIITKPADEHDYNIYALAGRKKTKKVITVNPRPQEPSKLSPKAAREISERIAEAVNTVARSTRMMGRKFAGMGAAYERWPHAIRTRRAYFNEWRTIGHELGHAFFFAAGFNPDPNEMAAVVKAVYPGGQAPAKTEIPEGFAEFFMLWFADNAEARRLAPNTARELEKYLNANPEIQEVFDQCMAIAEEDLLGTPLERMRHLTVRRGTRLAPAIGEYEVPWWKRLTFRFADGSIPLRDLYEEAASKGFDGLDPAKLYAIWGMAREEANQLFAGKPRFKYGGFVLPGKRSLQEIVEEAAKRPNGVILFNDIYKALRYQERAEKSFVTPYPKEEFDKTVEQAEKDYPDLVKLVKEYAENLSEINLRLLVAEEVISEEAADRIRKGSKYYLPLYYPAKSQVRGTAQDPLRSSGPGVLRYRGHTAQTLDFIEATLLRLHDTVQAVELNRMMKTIEESLKQPEMGRFGVFIERPIVVKGIRLDNLTRQIEDNFLGELDPDDESRVIKLFMPGLESDLKKSEPVIVARHGDKSIFMRIAPDLFEAVQSMRPIQYDWFTKVLTILAQVSRVGALANIRYLTNAFTRDVIQSGIQSKTAFERSMVKGFMQGALTAAGFGENAATLFDLYIQSGAYGSAVQEVLNSMRRSVTTDGLAATPAPGWKRTAKNVFVRTVNAPLDVLRILEEAPRIAEFEAVLKKELAKHNLTVDDMLKGKVPESLIREAEKALIEAAYASREVVVNFGLQGTSTGWRRYVRTVPFLQGSVQGIYRAYRQIKDAPGKTMLHWLVYVLPLTLIAWALSRDDDKYRDMPSDARDAYWWFPVGRATFIALAKPYEYALPANILERFLDWLADSDDPNRRKPLEDLVTAVKKSFSVQPTSMVVNTIWDLARNKTYFDSPIVPQREMQISPEYRYGPETKKASIRLAQIAALFMGEKAPSPRQVDYFMRGVFGGAGETFLDLLSLPLKGPGSEKRAGIEYAPVIGPLLYGPREGGSRIVDKFYQDYDRAQKLYNDYRLHGRKLTEQEARLVYAIPAMRALADDLASLRSELREIEQSDEYTPEEKRRAALRYNWISRVAAGYLYGQPVPAAPPQLEITEADVQDTLRRCEQKIELAIERARKKPGGPV